MAAQPHILRIAVPVSGEAFCEHFGRCNGFHLCDVVDGVTDRMRILRRPRTRCESVPEWLRELGVNVVLAGGIGAVGTARLAALGIEVITGHAGTDPQAIVETFIHTRAGGQANPCAEFEHRHRHCKTVKRTPK